MGKLVLTRKEKESVYIGDDIRVKIINIKGSSVQLAITAPKHVNIRREELADEDTQQRTTKGPA